MAKEKPVGASAPKAPSVQRSDASEGDTPSRQAKRRYKGSREVDHDLFKLELANFQKNVAPDEVEPRYMPTEHVHFFHSVDSNGKKQTLCAPVGGHFHEVSVEIGKDGEPVATVGPAMKWVLKSKKIEGTKKTKKIKVMVPIEHDDHLHEATYLESMKIKLRKANVEFAKLDAQVKARQQISVEGVFEK